MDQTPLSIKISVNSWQAQVDRCSKLIQDLSDQQLIREIAPGRNRGSYLVGHLAAVHDAMPEILGLGKRNYPELEAVYLKAADKTVETKLSLSELREIWTKVNERLKTAFAEMSDESWFQRHEAMTDAEFEKNPARNKLSVLLSRTGHLAYHFGQLALLK